MAQAGVEVIADSAEFAVMGISEVLATLPAILRARRRIWEHLTDQNVDLVVPVDFPGFNGGLASTARQKGIPVFWLIAPQVWAWGAWRIPGFRRKIDRLGTILPFETDFFTERNFDVFPMGHPLMEDYGRDFAFEDLLSNRESRLSNRESPLTIAILPGSRRQELKHLLPVLKVTTQAIVGHLADRNVRFVVSVAPGIDPVAISSVFDSGVEISDQRLPSLLAETDLALVCSGTASLEAALAGVPHELVYRTGALNGFLGRKLVRTSHIGLSNIILGRQMVREHLQDQASPLPLARSLLRRCPPGPPALRTAGSLGPHCQGHSGHDASKPKPRLRCTFRHGNWPSHPPPGISSNPRSRWENLSRGPNRGMAPSFLPVYTVISCPPSFMCAAPGPPFW